MKLARRQSGALHAIRCAKDMPFTAVQPLNSRSIGVMEAKATFEESESADLVRKVGKFNLESIHPAPCPNIKTFQPNRLFASQVLSRKLGYHALLIVIRPYSRVIHLDQRVLKREIRFSFSYFWCHEHAMVTDFRNSA